MRSLLRSLWPIPTVLMLLLMSGAARANQAAVLRMIPLLYPQTQGWMDAASLPRLPPGYLDEGVNIERFVEAPAFQPQPGCSPALRLFIGRSALSHFRTVSMLGPADRSLVYLGSRACAEGSWTIIWPDGMNILSQREPVFLDGVMRRFQPGPALKVVTLMAGCCGDPWSYICLYDPVPAKACTAVPEALVIPPQARPSRRPVVLVHDGRLFPSPRETKEPYGEIEPPIRTKGSPVEEIMAMPPRAGATWRLVRDRVESGESESAELIVGWIKD